MTSREFFEKISADVNVETEMREFADKELAKLDKRAAKLDAQRAEKKARDEETLEVFRKVLTNEPQSLTQLMAATNFIVTPQKAAYLLRSIDGLKKTPILKIDGKGTMMGYSL